MLIGLIVFCEVAFWVFLGAGLGARYLLRRRRLGALLLAAAPLVDLVLLVASGADLRRGGTPEFAHALAAIYLGVSVGFGHRMVTWADERFAHRYAGGPPPPRKPAWGRPHAAYERAGWLRHLLAYSVGVLLLGAATLVVGDLERATVFTSTATTWTLVLAIDFAWSFSYTLWPKRPATGRNASLPLSRHEQSRSSVE